MILQQRQFINKVGAYKIGKLQEQQDKINSTDDSMFSYQRKYIHL